MREACEQDLCGVLELDGHISHVNVLTNAVRAGHCWVARSEGTEVAFIVQDRPFYEEGFVRALSTRLEYRRRNVVRALIHQVISTHPNEKPFMSANRSNLIGQRMSVTSGLVRGGRVGNLDDGDPEIVYRERVR